MKSFQTFLLFWLIPLLIIFPVIIIQKDDSFWSVLYSQITFFTIVYFAIISFTSVVIINYLELRLINEKSKILLAALNCFFIVFVFSISLKLPFKSDINLFPPFFQGLIAIAIFLIEYLLMRLNNTNSTSKLVFTHNKFFYFKLLFVVFCIDFFFIFLLTLDTFINFTFIDYYHHINVFIPYLIGVVILSFLGIISLNKLNLNAVIKIVIITFISFSILHTLIIVKYKFKAGLALNFFMISFFSTILIYGLLYYFQQKMSINKLTFQNIQKDAQYLELKNQINPHFLFNNLNTLISFIEVNPKKALDFGHNLANVYRHYLRKQENDFVLIKDELLFIKEYLEIYKAKFENGFIFSIADEIESNQYILASALQELIDNIFKHNSLDEENPIEINIYIKKSYLIISNTLSSKLTTNSNNLGLENINKRYEILTNSSIIISKNENRFNVKLPILDLE